MESVVVRLAAASGRREDEGGNTGQGPRVPDHIIQALLSARTPSKLCAGFPGPGSIIGHRTTSSIALGHFDFTSSTVETPASRLWGRSRHAAPTQRTYDGIYSRSTDEEDRSLFDWDEHNIAHVLENGVEPDEAEQAVLDPRRVGTPAYNMGRERRWALLGATEEGRVLFVVYARRRGLVRVVTARDATPRERGRYRKRGK